MPVLGHLHVAHRILSKTAQVDIPWVWYPTLIPKPYPLQKPCRPAAPPRQELASTASVAAESLLMSGIYFLMARIAFCMSWIVLSRVWDSFSWCLGLYTFMSGISFLRLGYVRAGGRSSCRARAARGR
jgi:hypothetical protein